MTHQEFARKTNIKPLAGSTVEYIGLHRGPDVGSDDAIVSIPITYAGRRGDVIFARTIPHDDNKSTKGVRVDQGERLVFQPQCIRISIHDIDAYAEIDDNGYRPLANTIWTWLQAPNVLQSAQHNSVSFFLYLTTMARRLDTAYSLCLASLSTLEVGSSKPYIQRRFHIFDALGHAEMMCIALDKVVQMIQHTEHRFGVTVDYGGLNEGVRKALHEFRNAIEHVEDYAFGESRNKFSYDDAISIFNQQRFEQSQMLTFRNYGLQLHKHVIELCLASRAFIFDLVVAQSKSEVSNNKPIEYSA